MRDVVKTSIFVLIILLIIFVTYFIIGYIKSGFGIFTKNTLVFNDPTVKILQERVKMSNGIRKANFLNSELTNSDIINFVLDNLTEEDYDIEIYDAVKIVCRVTDTIDFITDKSKCNIIIINNDLFMDYQKKYFNTEIKLEYEDVQYKGYDCKNDGESYYCMKNKFVDSVLEYSIFDSAYEEKDKAIIRNYFLRVDVQYKPKCLDYFNKEYCENYSEMEKPSISDETIRNKGVLYEYVFGKNDNSYYLEKSYIVTEG